MYYVLDNGDLKILRFTDHHEDMAKNVDHRNLDQLTTRHLQKGKMRWDNCGTSIPIVEAVVVSMFD